MIKAVIFDADGVLINSDYFSKQYERDFGVPASKFLPYFNGVHQLILVGKADAKEELLKYLPDIKWNKSIDELFDYWHKVEHNIDEKLVEYIEKLKKQGIICCLATNQNKYRTEYMLNEMGFAQIFDHIFSSSQVGYKKPDLAFYQHMIREISFQSDEIVFWDNDIEHIEGAQKAGFHAELYTDFNNFKEKMKSYLTS